MVRMVGYTHFIHSLQVVQKTKKKTNEQGVAGVDYNSAEKIEQGESIVGRIVWGCDEIVDVE